MIAQAIRRRPATRRLCDEAAWTDLPLAAAALALLGLGLVMVASASAAISEREFGGPFHYAVRQIFFAALAGGVVFAIWKTPLAVFERVAPWSIAAVAALLVLVLIVGPRINGAQRWLPLGVVNLQVSEFVKPLFVVWLAAWLARHELSGPRAWRFTLVPLGVMAVLAALLMAEPDLGATFVLAVITLTMLFLAGMSLRLLWLLTVLGTVLLAVAIMLEPYRIRRFIGFVNPWADPFDSGLQLTQSLIAFGRGEWLGAGLGGGMQKLHYLPEAHTDFLFAVVGEELGFVGVMAVLALFGLLMARAFVLAREAVAANDAFSAHLVAGLGLLLGLQAMFSAAVNLGVMPTKGLAMPFMSYGGSNLLASGLAVGLLLRVGRELGAWRVSTAPERNAWASG